MKILILIKKWKGGVGRVVNSIKPLLGKQGHFVEVISREDDLKIYSLKESLIKLRKKIKSKKYDILYTQDWSLALPLIGLRNHYCCFHGKENNSLALQKLVYFFMKNRIIVVGDKLKKIFPKSTVIYNGVDTREFRDLGKRRNKIGWIKRDYELIDEKEFLELSREYNLKPSIATNIPPKKMNDWYNNLRVFVSYPPEFTGFNMCWLEAKASGVPIILGNENGIGISTILKGDCNYFSWERISKQLIKSFSKGLK